MHLLGHQVATSPLEESNKIPEKPTKIWHFGKAAYGKFALCYAVLLITPRLLLNSSTVVFDKKSGADLPPVTR